MIKPAALRAFVAVAELGNIRDAAAKLGRTPSAVSMTLKQLEEDLGGRLFAGDRKARLIALGAYVLEEAQGGLRRYERSVAAMRAYARGELGRLEIACVPSVAAALLPDLLRRFIAARPGVELDLTDTDSAAVEAAVERGRVELGIAGPPRGRGPVAFAPLFRDRFMLVCAPGSGPAGRGGPLGWRDLAGETMIANGASARIEAAGYRELVARSGLMVRNVTSLLALVRAGLGVTILPRLSVPAGDRGLVVRPLRGRALYRQVGLLRRSGVPLSPVAAAFADLLRTALAGPADGGGRHRPVAGRRRASA